MAPTSSPIHSGFVALTATTHLYTPNQSNLPSTLRLRSCSPGTSKAAPPSLIILCSSSSDPISASHHLERYISGYTITYPTSSILVLLSSTAQNKQHTTKAHEMQFASAVEAIVTTRREDNGKGHGQVLLHVFGDGGAALAAQLAWAHRLSTERPLDAKAILYDAAPKSEGVSQRVEGQRQRQVERRRSSSTAASTGVIDFHLPGIQRGRASRKNSDYNVLDGRDPTLGVGRAIQNVVGTLLQVLFAVYAYMFAFLSVSVNTVSTSVRQSYTSSAVKQTSKGLDDLELIAVGCRRCYVQPDVGYMACWDVNEDLSLEAMDRAQQDAQQQRRDSGVAHEDGEDEHAREEKRHWGEKEWKFGEVADDLFWEGVKGLWVS